MASQSSLGKAKILTIYYKLNKEILALTALLYSKSIKNYYRSERLLQTN